MSGGPSAYMPIYWGDYLRDTGHLSAAEHGAYLLLLGHYWTTGAPLPDDEHALRRIARMEASEWRRSRATIRAFFQVGDGVWRHKRVDAELEKARAIYRKRVEAASRRWKGHAQADADANGHAHAYAHGHAGHEQPQPQPHSPDGEDDGGDGARARPRLDDATERVIEAADADPSKQAGWTTASAHVAKWLQRGLDLDLDVIPAIRAAMISRRGQGPPNGPRYFDRAIIEAHERRLQPLPDVTIQTTGDRAHGRTSRQNDYDARRAAQGEALRRLAEGG